MRKAGGSEKKNELFEQARLDAQVDHRSRHSRLARSDDEASNTYDEVREGTFTVIHLR